MSLDDSPPWNRYAFHGGHQELTTRGAKPVATSEEMYLRVFGRGEDHPLADNEDWRDVT